MRLVVLRDDFIEQQERGAVRDGGVDGGESHDGLINRRDAETQRGSRD